MISNSDRFSILVQSVIDLLRQYVENSEDAEENRLSHFALVNTLASLEFLQLYANQDPNAVALMEELYQKHGKPLDEIQKH
tara:strand:- start:256 stop:498 length:243 start_codon:yes stop_codon:yes gene_type:complete